MSMSSRPASVRRYYRWLILLALLPLGVLLAIVVVAYAYGMRVQGLNWQGGLELAQWQRLQNRCVSALGERLRVTGWRPVTITMTSMNLPKCKTGAEELTPPPWTPPFDLSIDALSIPGLPPLAVVIRQREQRWQAQARYQRSTAIAVYDRPSGRWTAQGQIQAADIAPEFLGGLTFTGKGLWQPHRLDGTLQAHGRQLGYRGQSQRTDTTLEASLAAKQWQLNAVLGAPVAFGGGWSLDARQALQASGDLGGVNALRLDLRATGPQGTVQLKVNTEGAGVARGQGMLTLDGPKLAGTVPLRWNRQELALLPAAIRLPEELRLSWPRPLVLPLALVGKSTVSAELRYRDLSVKTVDSLLSWQQAQWGWQGRLDLAGKAAGHDLTGFWQGRIDAAGLTGEPASLTVKGPSLLVALHFPVADFHAPHWATQAKLNGHYGNQPITGTLSASYTLGNWNGAVECSSRPPLYAKGGALTLTAPWYGKDNQWFLGTGSRAMITEGLIGTTLIKPIAIVTTTPLRLSPQGIFGELQIKAGGAVTTRGTLPAIDGQLAVEGRQGNAKLQVPAWQSELALTALLTSYGKKTGAQGTVRITTPLSTPMSRSLGVTFQKGQLKGQGSWQWQDHWQLQGDMTASGLALDWGGILAAGGDGTVHIDWRQDGLTLASIGPVMLAELDVGTLVRNVRMTMQSDLATWSLTDVYADVLGGNLRAPALQWPSPQFQTVTVSRIDLAEVAALQNDPNPTVQLVGRVGGDLPLKLMKDSLALQGGIMRNEGPLSLKVSPSAGVRAMGQSSRAAQLALDTLSNLAIHDFQANVDMKPDGWLNAAVTIKGQNPMQDNQPVVLNYTHQENVLELLRSLRIGDEISRRVLERKPAEGSR
ncbi:YdbH domain-containing protein [Cupriavidus sp. CuC1]|uniref:intermembrane phospholipid transport protein YdbH family protein n=1 Tax=Cupriavidus sp. CuC1 TaxID=3373131 RepID=UPI0037D26CD2